MSNRIPRKRPRRQHAAPPGGPERSTQPSGLGSASVDPQAEPAQRITLRPPTDGPALGGGAAPSADDSGQQSGRGGGYATAPAAERAFLVGLDHGARHRRRGGELQMSARDSLDELGRLAEGAGAVVVGRALQRRERPNPATYIGGGKLAEIIEQRDTTGYTVVIFDEQLSPGQQLRLEGALGVKVLDRSALILDIFASRARTREAALQVELAQHEYLLPRLRGQWQHLERLEGSIGSRGPGETQLETDRRLIGRRISRLRSRIDDVRRQRALHRDRRQRQGIPVVALVGYTNAGKSSLLRALTGADALAADALFATLDPLTRRTATEQGSPFLLTDTVGFIQQLPTQLVSAFRATLEELESADLFLHVVDVTAPTLGAQVGTVLETLGDLQLIGPGAEDPTPIVTVLNKADALPRRDESGPGAPPATGDADPRAFVLPDDPALDAARAAGPVEVVSATQGWGIDRLRATLAFELYNERPRAAVETVSPS